MKKIILFTLIMSMVFFMRGNTAQMNIKAKLMQFMPRISL